MTRNVLFALTMKSVAKALGEYCTKEIPKGLLSLQLEDVVLDLEKPTTCGVPWQNLKVIRSHVSSVHSDGILAYTTLQELYLDHGSIDSNDTLDDNTNNDRVW